MRAIPLSQNRYAYVQNNPANLVDPTGEVAVIPILAVAWAALEIGLTTLDGIETSQTLFDPCASFEEKSIRTGLFLLGLVGPGAGYGNATKVGKTTVYQAFDEAGYVIYVGITDDLQRRAAEHLTANGIQIQAIEGLENLSRDLARGAEQALIELHRLSKDDGTLLNKINSISEKNVKYNPLERGKELLRGIGILVDP